MIPTEHEAEFEHLRFSAAVSQSEVARLTADNARLQQRVAELERRPLSLLLESQEALSQYPDLSAWCGIASSLSAFVQQLTSKAVEYRAENVRLREQLGKWLAVEKQIGPKDSIVGRNERLIADTEELLGNTQTQEKSE